MLVPASRSGGKAVRFCWTVASLFLLDGQGHSGEGWTGGGTEIPGRQRQEAGRSSTQRNGSQQQGTAKANIHACGSPENQADTENHLPTRYIVPRQCSVPPATYATCRTSLSAHSCLPCLSPAPAPLVPYLPCQWDVGFFLPSTPVTCQLPLCFY